ncbi:hypothetical protein CVT24_007846 [Panaeolus cyanescens]|uniref:Uncharacterized protein n=1 Tax=Panaeolus cyanescens TaxID=181874 RepID=A0A409VZE2_9AGAR|nr:hypothetical protein CVT24_007846 [Panaeolus cyanescens]
MQAPEPLPSVHESHISNINPIFPMEIFRHIIDEIVVPLPPHQLPIRLALKSAYQVSVAFSRICREHIYKEVEMEEGCHVSGCDDAVPRGSDCGGTFGDGFEFFKEALKVQPRLMMVVKSLIYCQGRLDVERRRGCDSNVSSDVELCMKLVNVDALYVEGQEGYQCDDDDSDVTDSSAGNGPEIPNFQPLLDHYLAVGQLTTLHLQCVMSAPILRILVCPKLRHLEMHNCVDMTMDIEKLMEGNTSTAVDIVKKGFKLKVFKGDDWLDDVMLALLGLCWDLEEIHLGSKMGVHFNTAAYRVLTAARDPLLAKSIDLFERLTTLNFSSRAVWTKLIHYNGGGLYSDMEGKMFKNVRSLTLDLVGDGETLDLFENLELLESLNIRVKDFQFRHRNRPNTLDSLCRTIKSFKGTLKFINIQWTVALSDLGALFDALYDVLGEISGGNDVLKTLRVVLRVAITRELPKGTYVCDPVSTPSLGLAFKALSRVDEMLKGDENGFSEIRAFSLDAQFYFIDIDWEEEEECDGPAERERYKVDEVDENGSLLAADVEVRFDASLRRLKASKSVEYKCAKSFGIPVFRTRLISSLIVTIRSVTSAFGVRIFASRLSPPVHYLAMHLFPIEIFRHVIDEIVNPLPPHPLPIRLALKSVYQVSVAFSIICREYIYKEVEMEEGCHVPGCGDAVSRGWGCGGTFGDGFEFFKEALKVQPALVTVVRSLVYHKGGLGIERRRGCDSNASNDIELCMKLMNVDAVYMQGEEWVYYEDDVVDPYVGSETTPLFRPLLDHYLAVGQLTTLHLQRVMLAPILRILACPKLLHLEMHDCGDMWIDGDTSAAADTLKKGFKLKVFKASILVDDIILGLLGHCWDLEEIYPGSKVRFTSNPESTPVLATARASLRANSINPFERLNTLNFSTWGVWTNFIHQIGGVEGMGRKLFRDVKSVTLDLKGLGDSSAFQLFQNLERLESLDIRGNIILSGWNTGPGVFGGLFNTIKSFKSTLNCISIQWTVILPSVVVILSALYDILGEIRGDNTALRTLKLVLRVPVMRSMLKSTVPGDDGPATWLCMVYKALSYLDGMLKGDRKGFSGLRVFSLSVRFVYEDDVWLEEDGGPAEYEHHTVDETGKIIAADMEGRFDASLRRLKASKSVKYKCVLGYTRVPIAMIELKRRKVRRNVMV